MTVIYFSRLLRILPLGQVLHYFVSFSLFCVRSGQGICLSIHILVLHIDDETGNLTSPFTLQRISNVLLFSPNPLSLLSLWFSIATPVSTLHWLTRTYAGKDQVEKLIFPLLSPLKHLLFLKLNFLSSLPSSHERILSYAPYYCSAFQKNSSFSYGYKPVLWVGEIIPILDSQLARTSTIPHPTV